MKKSKMVLGNDVIKGMKEKGIPISKDKCPKIQSELNQKNL